MAQIFKPGSKDWIDWVSENTNRQNSKLREIAIKRLGQVWIDPAICDTAYSYVNSWSSAGSPYKTFKYRFYDVDNLQVVGTLFGGSNGTNAFTLLPPFWPDATIVIVGSVEVSGTINVAHLKIDNTGVVNVNWT